MSRRFVSPLAIVVVAAVLHACGGPTPEASATLPGTSPPPASAAVESTSPASQSVAPGQGESGGPYAEALVAALASEDLSTHLEQTATARSTVAGTEVEVVAAMAGDIAGSDLALAMDISGAGVSQALELRVVGESAFLKQGDTWQEVPRSALGDTTAGLLANIRIVSDPGSLRYVGPETVDGRPLHHLTGVGTIPYAPATGGSGQYDVLDIWVEEDGSPVRIEGSFSATDAAGNAATGTTEVVFSNFGEPVEIEAPPVEPAATN